jgi:hypothetical protein
MLPKIIILGIMLLSCAIPQGSSLAMLVSEDIISVTGQVVDIDEQKRFIVVKWFDRFNMTNDEITVFVPLKAVIYKGTSTVGIMELNLYDPVKVEYYDASPGPLTAVKVSIVDN